jgi:hypothetical protein
MHDGVSSFRSKKEVSRAISCRSKKEVPWELHLLCQAYFGAIVLDSAYVDDVHLQCKFECKKCKKRIASDEKCASTKNDRCIWQFDRGGFIPPSVMMDRSKNHHECISTFEKKLHEWAPFDNFEEICPGFLHCIERLVYLELADLSADEKRSALQKFVNEFLEREECIKYELPKSVYLTPSNWDSIEKRFKKVLYHSCVFFFNLLLL